MTVTYDHYPELHSLIERLRPEHIDEVRAHILRLVRGGGTPGGLRVLAVFDGPEGNLAEESEEIIRREAGGS
jgi:hypothetical protein